MHRTTGTAEKRPPRSKQPPAESQPASHTQRCTAHGSGITTSGARERDRPAAGEAAGRRAQQANHGAEQKINYTRGQTGPTENNYKYRAPRRSKEQPTREKEVARKKRKATRRKAGVRKGRARRDEEGRKPHHQRGRKTGRKEDQNGSERPKSSKSTGPGTAIRTEQWRSNKHLEACG